MHTQQQNLHKCTREALVELGKKHESLVESIRKNQDVQMSRERQAHQHTMSIVVQTLWLRRTKDSTFMGHSLVKLPPNHHYDCLLQYPERYHPTLEELFTNVTNEVRTTYQTQMQRYQDGRKTTQPVVTADTWLRAARRARILSSFPELSKHNATEHLTLTFQEITENRWIQVTPGTLYNQVRTRSPYEEAIREIAGYSNCPKMLALRLVMEHLWGPDEKLVILAMSPASALIIYWVSLNPFRTWVRNSSLILVLGYPATMEKARCPDPLAPGQGDDS
jgi:hypothetical protein